MKQKLWKELLISEQDARILHDIIDGGIGKALSPEQLNQFTVGKERTITIPTRIGLSRVHLYFPEGEQKQLSLMLNLHGGGFVKGQRDQDIVFCRNICSRAGVVVADIDYAVAPQTRFPGQVYECFDILQYFTQHADEYGIDKDRIAIAGHSAGGTLAAAAILMAIEEGAFLPALQILDYPGLDMVTPAAEKPNGTANPRVSAWKLDFYTRMYVDPADAGNPLCSPGLAEDASLAKMPPTVMICCDNDTFRDEDLAFAGRLTGLGVPVYVRCFLGSGHGFTIQRRDEFPDAEQMILTALKTMI